MSKRKVKNLLQLGTLHIFYILLCFLSLVPILYALQLSFSGSGGALSSGLSILPQDFTLDNYRRIITEKPFLRWFSNSAVLAVLTMVIAIGFAVVAAYAFSRYRFRGRTGILKVLLLLNAFPQILSMFALFRLLKEMHMQETKLSLIVTAVMVLIFVWNEYLFSTTFLLNENSYTLAGGLYQLQSNDYSRSWSMFAAAAILVSLPVLVIFFCIQKYMVSGLTAGGVKG